ncbi:MAG: hypothetical protein AB1742_15495 [bacterium]
MELVPELSCVPELLELDAEFVNPFIVAANETLVALSNKPATKGRLVLTRMRAFENDTSIVMKIDGGLQGAVVFCMEERTAKEFVSSILYGVPVETLDDMARNSLEEFSIRVSQKAKDRLIKLGYMTNVRSSVFIKDKFRLSQDFPFLTLHLNTGCGDIQVFFNLTRARD